MARDLPSRSTPKSYAELKRGVEEALLTGQRHIEQARVRTYWETGRLIDAHVLLCAERADYGTYVVRKLEADLKISERVLYYCLRFARLYPILPTWAELSWGHYRALTHVEDAAQRKILAREAVRGAWTCRELEQRISRFLLSADPAADPRNGNGDGTIAPPAKLLTPKRGTPGLHPIVKRADGTLAVDLGFKFYRPLTPQETKRLDAGDIVRIDDEDFILWEKDAAKADLFTYTATVLRVVDGDTLVVELLLSPAHLHERKLRLRGIDCPELATPEGKAAKRFVDVLLAPGDRIVLCTTKPDKYDRYLADVFAGASSDAGPAAGAGTRVATVGSQQSAPLFLNNALLENGHAWRMEGSVPPEWKAGEEG